VSTLQDLRYKLQKRVQRLQTVGGDGLSLELVRFFDFFDTNPTLRASAAALSAKYPRINEELNAALQRHELLQGLTEGESAAIGLAVLRKVAVPDDNRMPVLKYVEFTGRSAEMLNSFRERYLDPFYEYIDEHIEDRNIVLAELVRFKHLAEWFRRGELWNRWRSDSRSGERSLAFAVYEFLYEQGIDFQIEPASASGEADMVSAQHSPNPLVADVKIFDPASSRGSSHIKRGLHQVYRYLHDFNQPVGYLVVFKGTEKQLEVNVSTAHTEEVPYFTLGDKTIFLVQVDIFPHEESASKRPIPEGEIISEVELQSDIESN
jgi:hypothetical protein